MPKVVSKLYAGQGAGRTDKAVTICFPLWENKNIVCIVFLFLVVVKS